MCFTEQIGYNCGHSSMATLRPCPMTTQHHQHPVCSNVALRIIQTTSMCPNCQRCMNTRGTLIEEYEHRFMHERNICGCKVKFPDLIRARLIGPANTDFRPGEENKVTEHVPPFFVESTHMGKPATSIRQHSLFAAEWVQDHRQLHEAGQCHCNGDFRTYQEVLAAGPQQAPVFGYDVTRIPHEASMVSHHPQMGQRYAQGGAAVAGASENPRLQVLAYNLVPYTQPHIHGATYPQGPVHETNYGQGNVQAMPSAYHQGQASYNDGRVVATPLEYESSSIARPKSAFKLGRQEEEDDEAVSQQGSPIIPGLGLMKSGHSRSKSSSGSSSKSSIYVSHTETPASRAEENHPVKDTSITTSTPEPQGESSTQRTKGKGKERASLTDAQLDGPSHQPAPECGGLLAAQVDGPGDDSGEASSKSSPATPSHVVQPSCVEEPGQAIGAVFTQAPAHLPQTGRFMVPIQRLEAVNPCTNPEVKCVTTFNTTPSTKPLVGLPIGAGPEQISHAGPWEQCSLHPMNRQQSSTGA